MKESNVKHLMLVPLDKLIKSHDNVVMGCLWSARSTLML